MIEGLEFSSCYLPEKKIGKKINPNLSFIVISGESLEELNGYGTYRPRNIISSILGGTPSKVKHLWISNPQDFRQVK